MSIIKKLNKILGGACDAVEARYTGSSESSRSSVRECCSNCRFFGTGEVWGHHGSYVGVGGYCTCDGNSRLIMDMDDVNRGEHKRRTCRYFGSK